MKVALTERERHILQFLKIERGIVNLHISPNLTISRYRSQETIEMHADGSSIWVIVESCCRSLGTSYLRYESGKTRLAPRRWLSFHTAQIASDTKLLLLVLCFYEMPKVSQPTETLRTLAAQAHVR